MICEICGIQYKGRRSKCPRCTARTRAFEPTPAEIRLACLAIQATWSPRMERSRRNDWGVELEIAVVRVVTDHMVRREGDKS